MTRNEEDFSPCRAWREIDLDALALNAAALQAALAPGCRLMAVLKAGAYGHGALLAARRLYREGCGILPWPAWKREFSFAARAWMEKEGFPTGETHIQASYGILNLPPRPCTLARAGIALYGVRSQRDDTLREMELRPVLSLRARVASVRRLEEGEGAGYGLAYRPRSQRKIAAITVGYGDGLPRQLAQKGGGAIWWAECAWISFWPM